MCCKVHLYLFDFRRIAIYCVFGGKRSLNCDEAPNIAQTCILLDIVWNVNAEELQFGLKQGNQRIIFAKGKDSHL